MPDPDLYAALIGGNLLAPEYRTALFDRIKSFRPRIATYEWRLYDHRPNCWRPAIR